MRHPLVQGHPDGAQPRNSERELVMGRKEKEAYQEKADSQLQEWQAWIEQYKSDSFSQRSAKSTTHQGLNDRARMLDRLEDCQRIAQVRLSELRSSNDGRWELAKQAVERALIDLKQALDESGAGDSKRLLQLQTNRSHVYEPFQRRG